MRRNGTFRGRVTEPQSPRRHPYGRHHEKPKGTGGRHEAPRISACGKPCLEEGLPSLAGNNRESSIRRLGGGREGTIRTSQSPPFLKVKGLASRQKIGEYFCRGVERFVFTNG